VLSARLAVAVLLVAGAFGVGLLLAGGDAPRADAEPAAGVESIDVADRVVDVPAVSAVRLPQLREEPKPQRSSSPAASSTAGTTTQEPAAPATGSTPSTGSTAGAAPPTGGSGSTSGSGQATKPDSGSTGSTGGSAEEGSTGS